MRTVERHEIDVEFAVSQTEAFHKYAHEDDIPRVERVPRRVHDLLTHSSAEMRYRTVADPTAQEGPTWESTTLAMQAGYALFAAGMQTEGTVQVRIHTRDVLLKATGPQWWTRGSVWLDTLYLAMICREKDRTGFLCSVTVGFLQASGEGGTPDPYLYPWIQALQGWWRGEPEYYDRLFEAVQAADPEAPGLDGEWVGLQAFPPMQMFTALVENDHAGFNDALFEALERHRTYWTATSDRAADPDGFVARAPLALSCLARELGFPIEVQSPYIPQHLVDGTWIGEFRT